MLLVLNNRAGVSTHEPKDKVFTGLSFKPTHMENEKEILARLQKRDIKALKRLCYDYAENMVIEAYAFLKDVNKANRVVDDLLLRIWREVDFLALREPLHTYLYGQVKRACEQIT